MNPRNMIYLNPGVYQMLESELVNLVHRIVKERCERQDLELKAAASGVPQRLYDTLSAFSNQESLPASFDDGCRRASIFL